MTKKPKFWDLIDAYGLDMLLCHITAFIVVCIAFLACSWLGLDSTSNQTSLLLSLAFLAVIIFFFIFPVLYFAVYESCCGTTLGKRIHGLQVVQDTKEINFWQLVKAYAVDIISSTSVGILLGGAEIGFIYFWFGTTDRIDTSFSVFVLAILVGIILPFVITVLYFAICESRWSKTLGKKLMGFMVVQEEKKTSQDAQN